jgi:hypothetical protein
MKELEGASPSCNTSSMEKADLPSSVKRKARGYLAWFEGINAASFVLISGQVMMLYALRLGADNFFIGVISSFQYISFFFMLLGRLMVGRMGLRRMMRFFWTLRYLLMVPVLVSPFLAYGDHQGIALIIIALALGGFNIARGIAIIGFNPILGAISEQKSMGAFLSRLQVVYHGVSIVCAIIVALSIGKEAPLWRYALAIGAGIILGLWGSSLIGKLPDPELEQEKRGSFLGGIRNALGRLDFRRFIIHFFLLSLVTGMAVPFVLVYAKEVYQESDQNVMFLTVLGGLGAVTMGIVSRVLMDRLGPKPLYILYTFLFTVALIPLVIAPAIAGGVLFLMLGLVFFLYHFGQMGAQISSRNYLFSITRKEEHLNLGIVYQLMMGVGNALGALGGGAFLRSLSSGTLFSMTDAYRVYFGILLFLFMVMMVSALFIRDVGRYSVGSALSIIFSPRDLRTVVLLDRLEKSGDTVEEIRVLDDIAGTGSSVASGDLLEKLKSPRFYIRARVLRALERMEVTPDISNALIREVKRSRFTTAHIAARIIGRKQIEAGVPALKQALHSPDYQLKANAMLALARIGGEDKHLLIEETLKKSRNPMVIMHGAVALQILGEVESFPVLVALLDMKEPPPFLRDEIILSLAALLSIEKWFYPLYSLFQRSRREGVEELKDQFSEKGSKAVDGRAEAASSICDLILKGSDRFTKGVRALLPITTFPPGLRQEMLEAVLDNPELLRFERLRFFLVAVIVRAHSSGFTPPGSGKQKRSSGGKRGGNKHFRRSDDPMDL